MPQKLRIEIYIPTLYNPDENGFINDPTLGRIAVMDKKGGIMFESQYDVIELPNDVVIMRPKAGVKITKKPINKL